MDTGIDNAFYVFNSDGTYVRFGLCKHTNLYTLDIGMTKPELSLSHTIMEDEKGKYSTIDIRRAKINETSTKGVGVSKRQRPG